ncbi:MAG: hypothetical protein HY721_30530 [Planctomycetes bacterium]|nr:hypothetical protein [Planctomycetota bacterium]
MWTPRLPPLETAAWLAPALAALVLAAGFASGWLKVRRGLRTGDTRKLFHLAIFAAAAVLGRSPLGFEAVNLLGGVMTVYLAWVLAASEGSLLYEGIAREADAPRRSLHIALPFLATAAGGIAAVSLFGPHAVVGFAVTGVADAIAEPIGIRWGRHRYRVPTFGRGVVSHRSLEGSAAVLAASFAAALAVLAALPPELRGGPARIAATAAAVAATAALVEAVSPHGLDNLTLQVAASGVAWGMA